MDSEQNPWWFHVLTREGAEPLHLTQGQVFSFGRHESNDVRISSRKASRRHATVEWTGSQAKLIDQDSNNGSFVNDRRVTTHVLRDGDEIRIATFVCIYRKVHDLLDLETESENEHGAMTTAGNNSMFSGHIHKTPLVEVLTQLSQDGTTGVLNLLPKLGQVGIKQGEPVWAFANQLAGEAALLQLLLLEKGMYIFSPQALGPETPNISRPLSQILASAIGRGIKPLAPKRPAPPPTRPVKPKISPPPRPSSLIRAPRQTPAKGRRPTGPVNAPPRAPGNGPRPSGRVAPGSGPATPGRPIRPPRQSATIRQNRRPATQPNLKRPTERKEMPKPE